MIHRIIISIILLSMALAFEEGDLVITEYFVKSNAAIPDYVEIYNTTDVDINLQNWTIGIGFYDPPTFYTITQSFFIPKHEYVFFSGEEGYFTDGNNILIATNDLRFYEEDDNPHYDEDLVDAMEGIMIVEISNGYWLPFLIPNHVGLFEIQDPSGNFIDGFSFFEGDGCPEFSGFGNTNRGHSVELKIDPNLESIENLNDNCENWDISTQTPSFMLNVHPDLDWWGVGGSQEYGSPGFSNNIIVGDSNLDGELNILDITLLVEYILGFSEPEYFLSDIYPDGDLNILDVVILVDMILND